ncbi:uncharacterized protein LOC125239479 [Leguminivora glycinivorella]|uniref:uncharacterized protein LOC125239479 n=1 Tax=Leguminivora glycinivorella TaxID=1035111 RepID=UPI002010361B|nr:uncharacterized protein LOC125239479 [Leguminivora glycinivorella]
MPKPKRSVREKIERYKRKLQDLEVRSDVRKKRRRHQSVLSSNESDVSEQGEHHLQNLDQGLEVENMDYDPGVYEEGTPPEEEPAPAVPAETAAPADPAAPVPDQVDAPAQPAPPATEGSDQPPLDPTLLAALGESTSETPDYGTSVHDSLANLWLPILKKGLAKDNKDTLLKEHLVPINCKLLQAPKLNAEIAAAVTEVVRGRDKKYVAVQQQLGQGIAAVSRAMDILLKTENKVEALKYLRGARRVSQDEPAAGDASPVRQHGCRDPSTSAGQVESTCSTPVAQTTPPLAHQPYPGCRDAISKAFSRRGVPTEAIPLTLASLSENTIKQYNVSLKLWWEFCNVHSIEVLEPSITSILTFLTGEFNKGCSYGTLNSHRSALALLLPNVSSDERVKRLLKGVFRLKPSLPKYNNTWDPQVVLDLVSTWYPNTELTLEKLTKKLAILLAICTAHRVQTFSLIKIENIHITENLIKISIPDLIKTSAPGREQPLLNIPYFRENLSICPALTLKDYILVTQNKRAGNQGTLLLTYKAPHRAATSQTVGRWIRQVLAAAGVDVSRFGAHSTRHASTSAASAAGVSIEVIRKAAGWTAKSQTFSKFYNRPLQDGNNDAFAKAVCFGNNISD